MTLYQKADGAWVPATQVYVKFNGVWVTADEAYVKRSGVWTNAYHYDVEPPPPPVLSLSVIDRIVSGKVTGNYIRVGVRVPGPDNIKEIKRVRVLTTYEGAYPTTQYGGTYTEATDADYPTEPWSEWRYNGFGPHRDTSYVYNKQFPRNATNVNWFLTEGRRYHFRAWTEDFDGNWSIYTSGAITGPKRGVNTANVITKQGRFQIISSGSLDENDDFHYGSLVQRNSPRSNGIFFYGDQMYESIGQSGTPTIKTAQIAIHRMDDDGPPTANVYIYNHQYKTEANLPTTAPVVKNEVTKLGTINKGEGKWFTIPATFKNNIASSGRGFGFFYKDPVKAAAFAEDYSVLKGIMDYQRAGEVVVTWTEAL